MSELDEVIERQAGVLTTQQAHRSGHTDDMIRWRVRTGQWQRLSRRIYWTFTGPVTRAGLLWAAVLAVGDGAVLSHGTAAELCGLRDDESESIHVSIPYDRRVVPPPGVVIHLRRLMPAAQPVREPLRTTVEETVVDLTQSAKDVDEAIALIARACARRLTTPERLREAFASRSRVRWREALSMAVADVADGCHSILEVRFLRDVERGHGLPAGNRQRRRKAGLRTRYSDVEYEEFGLVVELDGAAGHDGDERLRDRERDNHANADGRRTLRYGWADVSLRSCETAAQVVAVLQQAGWTGTPHRCGSACTLSPTT